MIHASSCSSYSAAPVRCTASTCARAVDSDGARSAEPWHHFGARVPPGRHPPRPLDRCSSAGWMRSTRPTSRPSLKIGGRGARAIRARRVSPQEMQLLRHIDMRYVGQWRSMPSRRPARSPTLPRSSSSSTPSTRASTTSAATVRPVEVYRLNVTAIGKVPKPELRKA